MSEMLLISSIYDYRFAGLAVEAAVFAVVVSIVCVAFLVPIGLWLVSRLGHRHLIKLAQVDDELSMLRELIDSIPDFIFAKDRQGRWLLANSQLARVVAKGESAKDLLGRTDMDFFPPETARSFQADDQNVIRTGQPLNDREEVLVDAAGNRFDLLTTKVPLHDRKGNIIGIAGIGKDITRRKRVENALREAEQRYRATYDEAIVGIFQSTPDGRFLSVNPAMARKLGYSSPEEMVSSITNIEEQFYADPGRRKNFISQVEAAGSVRNFECQAFRKDGSKAWLSMSVRAVRQNGVVVHYEGMCEDISERIELRDQLLQAQKLEAVGQLAAGIAHEINTPTQYVGDNVRFLRDAFKEIKTVLDGYERLLTAARDHALTDGLVQQVAEVAKHSDAGYLLEEIPKAIEQTLDGVTRVSTLVSAMKEFSHPGIKEKVQVDLNRAIQNTITVARNEWKYVANLETHLDATLPMVFCQPGEINQVILNLIVNAAHAIADVVQNGGAERGKITVETHNGSDWVEIRIQDTGTGIPETIRPRIFEPFFTTKEIGKGTGQGLAIARSIVVDKHGGTIHFETELGKGTTFVIRLPFDGKKLAEKVVAA